MLCFTIQISLIWCMPFPQKINLHWLRPYLLFTLILMYKENPDNIILLYPLGNSFRFLFLLIMWCLFYINFKITLNILLISFWCIYLYFQIEILSSIPFHQIHILLWIINQSSCQNWFEKWLEIHIHINRICEIQIDMIIDPSCKRLNQKFLIKFVRVWIFFARGNLNNYRWKYPMKDYHFPEKKRFCFEIFSIFLYLP